MFFFFLEHRHHVLLTRFVDTLTDTDLVEHNRLAREISDRQDITARIVDFTDITSVEAAVSTIVELAERQGRLTRVFIVPRPEIFGLARLYATHNSLSGVRQPLLTKTRAEAFALLDLDAPDFQPYAVGP